MPSFKITDRVYYGWILITAFLVFATLSYGTRYTFGVFLKSLGSEFELSRAATSGIFSAYALLSIIFAITCGWALDRYGPRLVIFPMGLFTGLSLVLTSQATAVWQLYITYSLLLGIGTGASYPMMMATISRWFDKKRGLAMGIASSGVGLGTLVLAPFASYLIINFDWRTAYMVLGVIAGILMMSSSLLLRKDPAEMGLLPDGLKTDSAEPDKSNNNDDAQPAGLSLLQAMRTKSFWFIEVIFIFWGVGLNLVLTHIVPHATDVGISAITAAGVLSLIGGMNIVGRLTMGWVSDRIGRKWSAIISVLMKSCALLLLLRSRELWLFYLFAVIYGFGYGGFLPSFFSLIGDIFGLGNIGLIMGTLDIGWGIGSAIGPPLGGYVFDVTQSYFIAFIIAALTLVGIALFVSRLPERKINRH